MDYTDEYPWNKIHEFLLDCGSAESPSKLAVKALTGIGRLVPYDQGRAYSISPDLEVYDDYLLQVNTKWSAAYYEYYSQILDKKYGLGMKTMQVADLLIPGAKSGAYFDWTHREDDEFLADYLRPQGIRYSLGFGLFDMDSTCKRTLTLDRIGKAGFSKREIGIMSLVVPHIESLHRNFYIGADNECSIGRMGSRESLTKRESEISDLLCKGFPPEKIATNLSLSRATVYKHISHIHTKMGVSSRQELLVKLFNKKTKAAS